MTELNIAVRNVLSCATQWAQARQKLRDLTGKVKDLHDRKSSTKEDFVRAKKNLDQAQADLVRLAEKLEKATNSFGKMPVALPKRRKNPVDLRKVAQGLGVLAGAVEQALTPQVPQQGLSQTPWQPPANVIDVDVIDITPKKK